MFIKGASLTGFPFGLVSNSTGCPYEGTSCCSYIIKDGVAGGSVIGLTAASAGNGQFTMDLSPSDMNAYLIGLAFTAPCAVPAYFTIATIPGSAIAASNIGGSAFDATLFKAGAITNAAIAASALSACKLTAGTIDAAAIAASAISACKIAASALDTAQHTDGVQTSFANALLDCASGTEANLTFRQWLRLGAAVLFGKATGGGTTTMTYRDFGDTADRVVATVTSDGDRSAVVYTAS